MKNHSFDCAPEQPEVTKANCHNCGDEFEELVSVLVGSFFSRQAMPTCINCDPEAEARACWRVNLIQLKQ